ncbi:MucB/RseB C-terminal domain-containing protein [Pontibacter sp. JAM-7]|uniref:MucB/RseB C-terminal domain-containing protein n=1 Tax=Pontibacter sp. JAM-7 TaxID=3366581 RepID=UPI003AF8CCCD
MSEQSSEKLSALMDGELGEFEVRRLMQCIESEPELGRTWQRYHVARSALLSEKVSSPAMDISTAVMQAVTDEETYKQSTRNATEASGSFWKPFASMAVAASVTAMVILGAQTYQSTPETTPLADARPAFNLPAAPVSQGIVRAQYGQGRTLAEQIQEPDIIRLPQGMDRYIEQHQQMLTPKEPQWNAGWLPEGFLPMRRNVIPHAELLVYSNGRNAFTVCIEDIDHQSSPPGVSQTDNVVAVGKRVGDHFVTVVGDVPLMIAERIAASVHPAE